MTEIEEREKKTGGYRNTRQRREYRNSNQQSRQEKVQELTHKGEVRWNIGAQQEMRDGIEYRITQKVGEIGESKTVLRNRTVRNVSNANLMTRKGYLDLLKQDLEIDFFILSSNR